MSRSIVVNFGGKPVPWARAARGRGGHTYTPSKQNLHRAKLAEAVLVAARGQPIKGAVQVEVTFDFYSEQTRLEITELAGKQYKTSTPDVDNLAKQVLEAIEDSGIIGNDAQVSLLIAGKTE